MSQALTWRPTMATVSDVTMPLACHHHGDFPVAGMRAMNENLRFSVRMPVRDEEATRGPSVEAVSREPDISRRCGLRSIARVDLEVRTHRNRPLRGTAPQACELRDAAVGRAGACIA